VDELELARTLPRFSGVTTKVKIKASKPGYEPAARRLRVRGPR
jgi:hypothetical protein